MQFLRDYRLPSTPYAIKQITSLYPMLEHIEESEREMTEKNLSILRLGAVLAKLLEHLPQKSHENWMISKFNFYFFYVYLHEAVSLIKFIEFTRIIWYPLDHITFILLRHMVFFYWSKKEAQILSLFCNKTIITHTWFRIFWWQTTASFAIIKSL